jgi:hypothetical protein
MGIVMAVGGGGEQDVGGQADSDHREDRFQLSWLDKWYVDTAV